MTQETYFSFPIAKVPNSSDEKLNEALQPIYTALLAIYNDFVYSCGVLPLPASEYSRLAAVGHFTCQPQNLNRLIVVAKEDLAFGSLIALEEVAGVLKAKLAVGGAGGIRAIGYVNTPGTILTDSYCEIILGVGLLGVSGAVVGTQYYLGTTPGTLSATPPGSGLLQVVGVGVMADRVYLSFINDIGSAADRDRNNHTGTQLLATISDAGDAAALDVGTTAGTVCAGDDSRLSSGYTLSIVAGNLAAPLDATTYYVGNTAAVTHTVAGRCRMFIPRAGTIKAVYLIAYCLTAGSAESWSTYVRLNNTTDTLIEALAVSSGNRLWSNIGLAISVVAGDYIEIKIVNPTWATDPANVRFGGVVYIE